MNTKKIIFFRHLLVWGLFITYELVLIDITVGLNAVILPYVIYYPLNIALFYVNAHLILDYAFFKTSRPYLTAILLIALELILFLFIKLQVDAWLSGIAAVHYSLDKLHEKLYLTNIFREIFFVGFSIAYWSTLYMVKFKERNHVIEKENLKQVAQSLELENKFISAENAYLQNQISPHLLFNTLNFIYNTVHRLSDRVGKGVMLLADLMRYSLLSSQDNRTVLLTNEVEQINKLIELSTLRFDGELYLQFSKKGKLKNMQIPPLILITLVENMLKHGDLGEQAHPGKISLQVTGNNIVFKTRNLKRLSTPYLKGGVGLTNIEKRLGNLFHDHYRFVVTDSEDTFLTELYLDL